MQPSGVGNLRLVVAGGRSRRSRSSVRHASSSPQMGCRKLWREGIWCWRPAAFFLGTNGIRSIASLAPSLPHASVGEMRPPQTLAGLPAMPRAISCTRESQPGGLMRQPTKPFIIERKPSRKLKPDASKPSIWGRLDAEISQGLLNQQKADQRDGVQAAATGGADRG